MRIYPYLPIVLFLLAALPTQAQQIPFLNHYTWDPRLFNPAAQGVDQEGEIAVAYRSQFQDLDASVRPNTYLLHADLSPLLNEHIGVAAQLMGDKTHVLNRFQFSGFFGYHLVQNRNIRFSLGAAAGIQVHNFDFQNVQVSDVLDLSVFNSQTSTTRFEGGPGMAFAYRTANGSLFAIDAAATQLFSSDIQISGTGNASQQGAIYDLIPHILINTRYRYQGSGFAIEPNIAFRALSGDRPLKAGVFDLNLNAFLLKNDRLMLGAGMRTDQGGLHFQLGLIPTNALRLTVSAELHRALGPSYEIGVCYALGKTPVGEEPLNNAPAVPTNTTQNLVQDAYDAIQAVVQELEPQFAAVRDRQNTAASVIRAGAGSPLRRQQSAAADSCAQVLAQTETALSVLQQSAGVIDVKRRKAEQAVRDASNQGALITPGTQATMRAIDERNAGVNGQLKELQDRQQALQQQCSGIRPIFSEPECLRNGDADCLRELFTIRLNDLQGKPDNLFPVEVAAVAGTAAITYHYPDDADTYALSNELRTLAGHIVGQMRLLEQQGIRVAGIALVTELQEDRNTLGYSLGLSYDGALGSVPIRYTLVDNVTGTAVEQNRTLSPGDPVNLEVLGALKLAALQQFLIGEGLPAGSLRLQLRFNHAGNIYREETKVVLNIRQ